MEKGSVAEKAGLHQSPLDLKHAQTMRIQKKITSSPYREHVTWAVFKNSIPVAKDSIDRIKEAHQHARGPQEWNRRFVLRNFD